MPPSSTVTDRFAHELVERCAKLLSAGDWKKVYSALSEMHDQLREEIPDDERFCAVFPEFVAGLIDRLGDGDIHSLEQAQVYANSANAAHRNVAGVWIKQHYRPR